MTIRHKFRSPFGQTGADIAAALNMLPRARQTVTRVSTLCGGGLPPRHVVCVVPHGATTGEHYEVSERVRELLEGGASPQWLELEPYEIEEIE